jgi:hypothetical protein
MRTRERTRRLVVLFVCFAAGCTTFVCCGLGGLGVRSSGVDGPGMRPDRRALVLAVVYAVVWVLLVVLAGVWLPGVLR